jgi:hypothetical protein
MSQKKIAMVNCYFGKLPWYFNYFVHSCKYNSTIDFFVITDDQSYVGELPDNVKLIPSTLTEINSIASKKLGFITNISDGYKLCDFKPTYGLLFNDLLKEYEFWGINDIDIILGNVMSFITDEMLSTFELISVRDDYVTGYFSLFKNNDKMNMLFTHSKDYERVLSSPLHFCFDETNFKHKEFAIGIPYTLIQTEIESMTHVVRRLQAAENLKAYFDWHVLEACPGKIKWDNGTLMYKNKFEAILYHLITLKETYNPQKRITAIPDIFTISPTRIYHHR